MNATQEIAALKLKLKLRQEVIEHLERENKELNEKLKSYRPKLKGLA
jgi:hypothetical protein